MSCTLLENYFDEHEASIAIMSGQMQRHMSDCSKCRSYYRFVSALAVLRNSLEKAPAELLPAVEEKIIKLTGSKER